ncbi:MAG: gluconate 2-dehydrogenase subunit 3 family protein [Actinobacteria bacterium]|nr:gluconate 2-dehydrogenase subunit 3 family protein [Actinomycetota bacterium]
MQEYPDYNVLDRKGYWDPHTRQIIERRMTSVPQIKFFSSEEAETLEVAISRILPQDSDDRIPVVPFVDEKLAKNITDGTRYEDMPQMQELWRMFIRALDEEAQSSYGERFIKIDTSAQDEVLGALSKGDSNSTTWKVIPAQRAFQEIIRVAASFYYSHPYAWNEIGWGGPKYPEVYVRIGCGRKDPEEPGVVGHVRE